MLTILAGKSCSGKDTILKELLSKGYERIITYTTRPIRHGEIRGVTYHYIDKSEFENKVANGFFAEHKVFHTEFGDWYYGMALEDITSEGNKVAILTPEGIVDIKKVCQDNIFVLYIFAYDKTIKKRLSARGDDKVEATRRFNQDAIDFKDFQSVADKIVYNNDGTDISDVVNKVISLIEKRKSQEDKC